MIIGIPKEIKDNENRIAIVPAGVEKLVKKGHKILVEKGAGLGSSIPDKAYKNAGAQLRADHADIFANAEMIVKVKEPLREEYNLIKEKQMINVHLRFA